MNPHLQPWSVSPDEFPADSFVSDRIEYLLQYAILAPSPHNTQPWMFRINTNDVEVYADLRRRLNVSDPEARELVMSCGAALLNLRVAGGYFDQKCSLGVLPDESQSTLVARLTLHSGGTATADDVVLFPAIVGRRTNRGEFNRKPVPGELMDELGDAAVEEGAWLAFVTGEDSKESLAELIAEGDRRQWANPEFRAEMARWMRTVAEHQSDGIPTAEMGVRDWLAFAGPALVRTFDRGDRQAARDSELTRKSPLILVLGTDADTPAEWVRAGQAMQRVLLTAQSLGLSVSHLNQPVEVDGLRSELAALAGREGAFPQVLLRVGYGKPVAPTPRRQLRDVVLRQNSARALPHGWGG